MSELTRKPTAWDKKPVDSRLGPNKYGAEHPEHKNGKGSNRWIQRLTV